MDSDTKGPRTVGQPGRWKCDGALPYLMKALGQEDPPDITLSPDQEPVTRRFSEGVLIGYLVDQGAYFQYVQRNHMTEDGLTEAQLHETARQNLKAHANSKLRIEKYGNVFAVLLDGNLEASLLLIDELWDQVANLTPNGVIAAVPARDMLTFCDVSSSKGIAELRQIVARVTQGGDHLITTALLRRVGSEWVIDSGPPG